MSKVYAQATKVVLSHTSGCLAANGTITGSAPCNGYAALRGGIRSDVATSSGSGVKVEVSLDGGINWDIVAASDALSASGDQSYNVAMFGTHVRVTACNGAAEASALRAHFALYPNT